MARKVSVSELHDGSLLWGDVLKLNALLDMEDDMKAAYTAYQTPKEK